MDWIALLRDWQTLIGGVLTIAAAFIGGSYVVGSTKRQISLLTSQFRETTRPFVVARLNTHAGVIFTLEIENTGRSPARNLRLTIDRDFFRFVGRQNLKEMPAFNQEIEHFAPGEKLVFNLVQAFNLDKEVDGQVKTPRRFSITAVYFFDSTKYVENYAIDMSHYLESTATRSSEEWLEEIAKHLKQIASHQRN